MKRVQVDMHMHTVASDGTQTPAELLNEIKEKDIKVFAITDHDSVENVREMMTLTEATDITYIPGVEISTTYKGKEIHLLTYGIEPENEGLLHVLSENIQVREVFNLKIIKHVKTLKGNVSVEDYLTYNRDPSWGGWKAENYLREIGAIHHLGDLFDMLGSMEERMTFKGPDEIIPVLKSLGAKIVLAHPPAYYGGEALSMEFLDYFKELGVDGIECFSPYYKEETQSEYYTSYCKKNNLMISCGSDYHGVFIATRHLGYPEKYLDELSIEALLKMGVDNSTN